MDWYFKREMSKLEELSQDYDNYNELEKLDKMGDINNSFEIILKQRMFKHFNIKLITKIHDLILKFNCLKALIRLDNILLSLPLPHNVYYQKILNEDINQNAILLAKNILKPFIIEGFNYQLSNIDKYYIKPFDYSNPVLNRYGKDIIKSVLGLIECLEFCLQEKDLNINLIEKLYQTFTTKQLAFIYAQLNYHEFIDGVRFENGSSNPNTCEANEKIFRVLRKRNDNNKIEFMKTICNLKYCNESLGICAMLVELLKTKDGSSLYRLLIETLEKRNYGLVSYDTKNDADYYLEMAKDIKKIRDNDIASGESIKSIYSYRIMATSISNISYRR